MSIRVHPWLIRCCRCTLSNCHIVSRPRLCRSPRLSLPLPISVQIRVHPWLTPVVAVAPCHRVTASPRQPSPPLRVSPCRCRYSLLITHPSLLSPAMVTLRLLRTGEETVFNPGGNAMSTMRKACAAGAAFSVLLAAGGSADPAGERKKVAKVRGDCPGAQATVLTGCAATETLQPLAAASVTSGSGRGENDSGKWRSTRFACARPNDALGRGTFGALGHQRNDSPRKNGHTPGCGVNPDFSGGRDLLARISACLVVSPCILRVLGASALNLPLFFCHRSPDAPRDVKPGTCPRRLPCDGLA